MTFRNLVMLPQISTLTVCLRGQFFRRFCRTFSAYTQKTQFTMDKVYLRNAPGTSELQISFRYKNADLNIDREFNFCRNVKENIDDALVRMRCNIEKELNKKSKKRVKKQKNGQDQAKETAPVTSSEDGPSVIVDFVKSNEKVQSITFAELIEDTSNLSLQVLGNKFEVLVNTPWVINLVLPQSILAGFLLYPSKMELQFADQEHSTGTWYKGKMPSSGNVNQIKWVKCGDGLVYHTQTDDIDYHIKFELRPGNATAFGPPVDVIAKNKVQAGPGKCPFEERHKFTQDQLSGNRLRVISYNILADLYADSDYTRTVLFPYCLAYALRIDYRKQLLLKEIIGYNGDVICLQEVDVKVFNYDLMPVLHQHGFMGVMQQKGSTGEGSAMFYRSSRFELLRSTGLQIGENVRTLPVFRNLWERIKDNTKLVARLVERATTLQLNILKSKDTGKVLMVANTHLFFHPDADHIRLLQMGFSMLYIEHMYKKLVSELETTDDNVCLLFCGDFNSVPECGIYKLMTEKFVGNDFIDWSSNPEEAVKGVSLSQPFNIASACGTPPFTNYTENFAACLDYIFYQTDHLTVDEVIPLPTEDELKTHIAIPSVVFPSDHVALVANLRFNT